MLFSLCPAITSTRICRSAPSTSSPSRASLMTADPRMLSEPALQIVKRTTPRGSRSTPQWELSSCMTVSQLGGALGADRTTSRPMQRLVKGSGISPVVPDDPTRPWPPAVDEIKCSFSQQPMLLYDCKHLMEPVMRYSKEHKLETRARIVKKASMRLRERGAHGIGVADLMKDAVLTHGGFYAHFDSREALVIEAFSHAMDRSTEHWRELAE